MRFFILFTARESTGEAILLYLAREQQQRATTPS